MFELVSLLKDTTKCPENVSGNFRCTDLAKIPPISWSRSTKCPKKFSGVLYVMSLLETLLINLQRISLDIWWLQTMNTVHIQVQCPTLLDPLYNRIIVVNGVSPVWGPSVHATWFRTTSPLQALIPICGWLMVVPGCVSLSGCQGWLLRYSDHFLYGDIGLLRARKTSIFCYFIFVVVSSILGDLAGKLLLTLLMLWCLICSMHKTAWSNPMGTRYCLNIV